MTRCKTAFDISTYLWDQFPSFSCQLDLFLQHIIFSYILIVQWHSLDQTAAPFVNMHHHHASLFALTTSVLAQQSLNATLSGNQDLSNLTSFLALNPSLLSQLSNATNITILAPNDDAFNEL